MSGVLFLVSLALLAACLAVRAISSKAVPRVATRGVAVLQQGFDKTESVKPSATLAFIPTPPSDHALTPANIDVHEARDHIYGNKVIRHPYHQTMAHQQMQPADWIEPDKNYKSDLEWKAKVLKAQGKAVCDVLPDCEEACGEMLILLSEWLVARYPELYEYEAGDKRGIRNLVTGETHALYIEDRARRGVEALRVISRLVQDDFLIARPSSSEDGSWICAGGLVCFPGFYLVSHKIGLSLHDTHAPVPQFNEKILRSVERSLTRLKPEAPIERTSWEIVDDPDHLFWAPMAGPLPTEPGRNGAVAVPMMPEHRTGRPNDACVTENPADLVLRLDHQTFIKLPKSGCVFFGIHPMRRKLSELATLPLLPALLLKVHEEAPADLMEYKAAPLYSASVLPYLKKLHNQQIAEGLIRGDEDPSDFRTAMRAQWGDHAANVANRHES
ncbi:hypothetical protein IE81DRAFT_347898 [Ceraceosorus guamensis]|uniref:Uncharacterized protein n=1 Tax=Ceraceosorus guamensis TaxID=1522189 RepID=A0A316VZY3_9BASI|nr:hypothetical protein IE81DRAFT_347898 [Ceraceosorus guamensis]PWN42013.1 hypothetical protein IE81DRAFT_347898 [Ceraceosorus guamensis]